MITWIGKSGIGVAAEADESSGIRCLTVRAVPIANMAARTSFGELEVSYAYRLYGDRIAETAVNQNCRVELRFAESKRLEDTLESCVALQQLVTIGVDAPVSISSVSLLPVRTTCAARQEGTDSSDLIRLYAELPGSGLPKGPNTVHASKMLFTFDDIGGMDGVAAWLSTANELGPVVGLLTSHWYMPTLYIENRFFNAITAAETLQRIREPKSKDTLRDKLRGLACQVGAPFVNLVGDVDSWANIVVKTRNRRIVHRGLHENSAIDEIYWLAESVYFLLVLYLLRHSGVPKTSLEGIRNRPRCAHLSKQLARLA